MATLWHFPQIKITSVILGPFPSEQIPRDRVPWQSVKTNLSLEDAFRDGLKESGGGNVTFLT
jgi:hypothetical protein